MRRQGTRAPGHHGKGFDLEIIKLVTWWLCVFVAIMSCSKAYALNLDNLKVYFLSGDYKTAISEGEKLISQDTPPVHSDELYYILGLSYLKDGNHLRASDIFDIILKEFKDSKFKEEAKLGLGDAYFLRGDFAKARDCYQELITANPHTKLKAQIFYRLSQIGFKEGDIRGAKEYLDKLKEAFPLNPELRFNQDLSLLSGTPEGIYYTVQAGAFSNITNARNLMQKLIQKGYAAYIEEVSFQGKTSYRVRVGKTRLRQEAIDLEKKLIQEGYPTKICP